MQALPLSASEDVSAPVAAGQFSEEGPQPLKAPGRARRRASEKNERISQESRQSLNMAHEIQDILYKDWPGRVVTKVLNAHQCATSFILKE